MLNHTMLMDFYELTMANGYLHNKMGDRIAYFDMYFRKVPDGGGFAITAGLEQLIDYLQNLTFTEEDISYLRGKNCFCEEFLDYLRNFKFTCDVWAIPEGTPVFPGEPLVIVRGPVMQAQLIETMVLLSINHQSLIATKANRIVRAAEGRTVMEFGSRRAQGYDGAIYGARASYIGGCVGTACALAEEMFGIPALGTMAHSWVQLFDDEFAAFAAYANAYPDNTTLLIDTYNVLKSGLPNAIRVHKEILEPMGKRLRGVRIDSGDITYLTKKIRRKLDEEGMEDCQIVISNSLDEYIIRETLQQGACIDSLGVGERLITSRSEPVFGGVYKLVAVEDEEGKIEPKIKLSENVTKITTPGFKELYRLYNTEGAPFADVITLYGEGLDDSKPYTIFHPEFVWKRKTVTDFTAKPLLRQIYREGQLIYECPTVHEIRKSCLQQVDLLWDEIKRFENPHIYYVDLSPEAWKMKQDLLERHS